MNFGYFSAYFMGNVLKCLKILSCHYLLQLEYTGTTKITCKLPGQASPQFVYFIGATDGTNEA